MPPPCSNRSTFHPLEIAIASEPLKQALMASSFIHLLFNHILKYFVPALSLFNEWMDQAAMPNFKTEHQEDRSCRKDIQGRNQYLEA